jgi:hypothetical protein
VQQNFWLDEKGVGLMMDSWVPYVDVQNPAANFKHDKIFPVSLQQLRNASI